MGQHVKEKVRETRRRGQADKKMVSEDRGLGPGSYQHATRANESGGGGVQEGRCEGSAIGERGKSGNSPRRHGAVLQHLLRHSSGHSQTSALNIHEDSCCMVSSSYCTESSRHPEDSPSRQNSD